MQSYNQVPEHSLPFRLACIFTSPAKEDAVVGQPFNDPNNGLFLRTILQQMRVDPANCFFGYLDKHVLTTTFKPDSVTAQVSLAHLRTDLDKFKPNCILIFGRAGQLLAGKGEFSVDNYRGSIFECKALGSPFFGYKCIIAMDIATVMTTRYDYLPLLKFDIRRAVSEANFPDLRSIPTRNLELTLGPDEIIQRLDDLNTTFAFDIEGGIPNPDAPTPEHRYPTGVTCLSIATDPYNAFIIPLLTFSVDDTLRIILKLREKFADPSVGKILQNGMYDTFVLAYMFNIHTANVVWDTMLSGFELYPEFPKSLAVQTSLYTFEPFYKADRKSDNLLTLWAYCCKDSCVTFEIAEFHRRIMSPAQLEHFRFNMKMLPILLYMELRGMSFDQEMANAYLARVVVQMAEIQTRINTRVGYAININSPKQLNNELYTVQGFPKQHPPKKSGRGLDTTRLTSNVDAILTISQKTDAPILHEILAWRKLEKWRTALGTKTDSDGRIRCSYNVVGTETNRLSSSKSPTGRGCNLQTITKKLRPIFSSGPSISKHTPEPRYFFQVDLAGADGWTVAAHCHALGDPTMLLDYLAGIKPARVIGLMHLQGSEVSRLSREELRIQSKCIGEGDTEALYFTCKQVQHGSNYQLGHAKMAQLIVKQSYKHLGKAIRVSTQMCGALQNQYFQRYKGVQVWQKKIEAEIRRTGRLHCASGHVREFFGRRNSSETFRQALAQEPQHNTTYVDNRAVINLWEDPENRNPDGSLLIEPHHLVHDSLNGSFPQSRVEWAIPKIQSYFDFKLNIAGQSIHIPFEGEYGERWGQVVGHF